MPLGLVPFQGSLLTGINIADDNDSEEDEYGDKAGNAESSQADRPGIKENYQHVEDQEGQCVEVKAEVKLHPGFADGVHTALEWGALFFGRMVRDNFQKSEADGQQDGYQREADGEDEKQDYITVPDSHVAVYHRV